MENFIFQNPSKIIFGKGTETTVGEELKKHTSKILLHYGSGSIKKTGLYNKVIESLNKSNIDYIELSGVQANPRLKLVYEGIDICRKNKINFILAVGGGSVIDSAKAISVGVPYEGDVWDFFTGKATIQKAIPIATILTIPAAGSEASTGCVITKEEGQYKRAFNSTLVYPIFSILNPEITFTLSKYQKACGIADMMAHIMERYFTNTKNVELTDRLCEATMTTIINNAFDMLEQNDNYEASAEIMRAGTIAHNNILNTGRIGDRASHAIEHELSGIYDIAHGEGLAIIFPAWMKYVYRQNIERFAQFAKRIRGIEDKLETEQIAKLGIQKLESFFRNIGLATNFKEANIPPKEINKMAAKCAERGKIGNFKKLDENDILEILKLAL